MSETPATDEKKNVTPPRTINLAAAAMVAEALAWIGSAIAFRTNRSGLVDFYFKHNTKNDKAKSHYLRSNPKDVHTVTSDVGKAITATQTQAVILTIVFVMLAVMVRKTRGASASRWVFVIVCVLTSAPFQLLSLGGDAPSAIKVTYFLVGLMAVLGIVLLFLPPSSAYFREIRALLSGGQPARPMGGLFAPRQRPATTSLTKTGVNRKTSAFTSSAASRAQVKLAKATQNKQRTEAVAKGAELARNRAKAASKSRRMED